MGFLTKSNVKGLLAWTKCQLTRWEGSRLGRGMSQTAMQILQSLLPPTQSTEVSIHCLSSLTRNGLALLSHVMCWIQAATEKVWPGQGSCVPLKLILKELAAGGPLFMWLGCKWVLCVCVCVCVCVCDLFIYLLAMWHGGYLSSPIRFQTHAPCIGSTES